jgi:hypothetical protein
MAAELAHNGVAILLAVHLDSMTDVADPVSSLAAVEAEEESLAGNLHQALHLGADRTHGECVGRVGHIAVELNDAVEGDIVALLDEEVARDAVHHYVVDRDTEGRRETLETLAQRFGAMVADKLLANLVEERSSDTRTDMTAHLRESFPEEEAGITYELYFFFCLEQYHSFPLTCFL